MNIARTNQKVREFYGINMMVWNLLDESQRYILRMEYIEHSIPGESLLKALKGVMEWWNETLGEEARPDEMPAAIFDAAWQSIHEAERLVSTDQD